MGELPLYRRELKELERKYWLEKLEAHGWSYSHVARATGIDRPDLYRAFKRLDIKRPTPSRHDFTSQHA